MPIVASEVEIRAGCDALFWLAQDYELRLAWDPFLRRMEFRDGATEAAVGVRVWVRARNGLSMEVEYITLDPPRTVAMKMTNGPFFFGVFAGSWRFEAIAPDTTRVVFRYAFSTRWTALGSIVDPLIVRVFERDITRRLEGLKRAAEQTDILCRLEARRAAREVER